jgi:hypothetical protein
LYQTKIITQAIAGIGKYLVIGAISITIRAKNIAAKIAERGVFAQAE